MNIDLNIFSLRTKNVSTKWPLKSALLAFIVFTFFLSPYLYGQNPFIPRYDAVKRSERCFTVTYDTFNQFGAVWWAQKVDFSRDTAFNFVVYMGDRDGGGADGLAFVMHQDPRDTIVDPSQQITIGGAGTWDLAAATGDDGGGLGFAMHQSRVGPNTIPGPHGPGDDPENHKIQKSVAIELDTWNNTDVPDGRAGADANGGNQPVSPFYGWDHASVVYNGDIYGQQQVITDAQGNTGRILPLKPGYIFGTGNNPDGSVYHNIEDDRCYMFQVKWIVNPDGTQTMQLWADMYNGSTNLTGLEMVMTHTDDMLTKVFNGDPVMRFGFTGSTGGARNEQTICLLGENLQPFAQNDFATIPLNTTTVVDVEANDNDPDGDQLHVPVIFEPANHGNAVIFDSLGVNYMRYAPNTNYVGVDTVGYVTCDVNSTKCYAKCDTAYVFITVGCIPFDVDLTATSQNITCDNTLPANGAATADVKSTYLKGTLWYEGFEDLPSGTIIDNGTSSWSTYTDGTNCKNGNQISTFNFEFRVKVVTNGDCEVVFETEEIDISAVSNVDLSIDLKTSNAVYESSDYLRVYYKLDGGPEILLDNGNQNGTFGFARATVSGLNGKTLQLIVRAKSDKSEEEYFWDNIHVRAIGALAPNVTYSWYQGPTATGQVVNTGSVYNGMRNGDYTVVALDISTGCPSNPATITIDSSGYRVHDGYIVPVSPFTNCNLPYDGALAAGVFDGTDSVTVGYEFEWYFQEDPKLPTFIQRTGSLASNLASREYTVVITEIATGCDTAINAEVPNAVNIPLIVATKIQDILSCSDPNSGIGAATVGGTTNGYRFEWYAGPAIGAGPPDFTGSQVNTFAAGTYTVQAIDSITSCPSDPASITFQDLTITPNIQISLDQQQISCDPLLPTGQVSGAVIVNGVPTTLGFAFNWYQGPNDIVPARPGYTGGPVADQLDASLYRLVVIENGTNCTAFKDTTILDQLVTPAAITITSTPVTFCNSANGSITVNVVGSPVNYTYELYSGTGVVAANLIISSASHIFQNLAAGNYTVLAKDLITRCPTNPVFVTIIDNTALPLATISSQDQVSCDPNNLTGALTASTAPAPLSDFSFVWFENDTTGLPLPPTSTNSITGLDTGTYALRVTNNVTQCKNVFFPTVNPGIVLPIESLTATPSTFCAPSANGQMSASADGGLTAGYTFIWVSLATGDTLVAQTPVVNTIAPGDYSLTIRNNTTACLSNPAPVNVADNSVIPMPVITVVDNSSCDVTLPNGQLTVTATTEAPTYALDDYFYEWINNISGTAVSNVGGSYGESAISLASGTYELRIRNNTTLCANSVLSQIIDINIKPVIDQVIPDHADHCVEPFMSGASVVSVNGGLPIPAGFTFSWFNRDGGPAISSNTGSIADMNNADEILPPGNYGVVSLNQFSCPSDTVLFEILDNSVPPVFQLNPFNNISCDSNTPLGSLVVFRPDNSYTISLYEWFLGAPGSPFNSSSNANDSSQINLAAGIYSVRITDARTGCTSVEFANIQDAPAANPSIINTALVDLTRCDIDNGELAYRVLPFENIPPFNLVPRSYTFYLSGSNAYQQTTSGIDNVNFTSIGAGNWSAYVVDEYTKCQSDPITNILTQAPEIQITSSIIQKPASCVGNNGILKITAFTASNDSISGGAGFSFEWLLGFDGSGGTVPFVANNGFRSTASGLTSDYYHINVSDNQSMCTKDTAIFVPSQIVPDIFPFTESPSTSCINGNGWARAELSGPTPIDYTQYDFLLFRGKYFDPNDLSQNQISSLSPATNPSVFNNLDTGNYTLVAIENFGDNCLTSPISFTIDLDYIFPTLIAIATPDKSCIGGTGTGQLEITNTSPVMALGDLSFSWLNGNTGPQTVSTLYSGNYSVEATITANIPGQGCKIDTILNVPKNLDNITLVGNPTPNNNCAPFDGTIAITDVRENTTSIGGVPGNYVNFIIYDSSLTSVPSAGNGFGVPWGPLAPGNYFVQAQNNDTKCYSEFTNITIDDLSVNPVIAVTITNPDYACDPTLATGVMEAEEASSGSQNLTDYDFNWYTGGVDPLNFIVNNPVVTNRTANLFGQLYTIEMIDRDGANRGCRAIKQVTLTHQPTKVYMLSADIDTLNQTICGPNGSIQITQINEDDGSGAMPYPPSATYSAQLLSPNLNPIDPISNPYAFYDVNTGYFGSVNVPAGLYYVRASKVTTGCQYGPISQVIVKDVSKKPIISATLVSPDYACAGGIHTGELTPTVFGGSDLDPLPTNFAITWIVKANGANAPGGTTATTLWPGTYTLQVVDATGPDQGCMSTRDYIVPAARRNIAITASGTDQTVCFPDGTLQVDNVSVDMVNQANPHLYWTATLYDGGNNLITTPPSESGFASISPFGNLTAGTYFVRTQNDSTKCFSNSYQVRLRDISTDPLINVALISPQYSLNPNPVSWTGAMQATVTETNGLPDPGGYTYTWHSGIGTGNPAFSLIDNFAMADEGNYTFVAINNTTQCQSQYDAYLPYVYLEPRFNTLSFAKTICAPTDGFIDITNMTLDGNVDLLSDYTFSVYHDSFSQGDPANQVINGLEPVTTYAGINSGDYYFIARENWWWVESLPVKVTVIDSTTNPVIVFNATDYRPVTSCDESIFADGALSVDIFEDSSNPNLTPPFNYSFSWFAGNSTDAGNQIAGADTTWISEVPSGVYTVLVRNEDNNCEAVKSFTIEDESVIPLVAVTQSPNTNCPDAPANGIVNVTVINSNATYDFNWYTGTTIGSTPEYTGVIWRDRQPIEYTVVAIDPNLPTCISAPKTIKVENATEVPIVVIREIAPISNCDPARPNGVLSAVTQDGISGHTFEWYYEGTLYTTGPVASNLGLFTYDLVVTNDVTNCRTNLSSAPSRLLGVIPPPDVDILSDRTSCLKPDGFATATVSGNVVNYIFRFYNKFSGQELTNLYDDFKIYDLDTSTYLVTAESRNTGCVSDPTEFSIDNASYFPRIDVIADPSACNEPNGAANVIISDLTQDFKVTWYGDNGFVAQEKELVYLPVGKYLVEVEGTDGCISTAETEVKADIVIYNGVSANNDGSNDFFHILCLELFMNNNVKIYNRAGMLVYEQNGYDMNVSERRFNGISNRGTSILGTELPIGTYFYVVDKSDGSKAKVGYLELVR